MTQYGLKILKVGIGVSIASFFGIVIYTLIEMFNYEPGPEYFVVLLGLGLCISLLGIFIELLKK